MRIPVRMRKGISFSLFLGIGCFLAGCSAPVSHHAFPAITSFNEQQRALQTQLSEVVAEDGIDGKEANVIARNYWERSGMGCGMLDPVTDGGAVWVAETAVGYSGRPTREPIRIDKGSGKVTWSNGPTVRDPKSIWTVGDGRPFFHN